MTETRTTLDKIFNPAAIEAKWYKHWESNGLFRPHRPDAVPFTIVNPPPNVTGSLHVGHALDNTLQDIVVRYERLRGKDALWVIGTDHAGIATQMVVERQMEARQDKRTNYAREDFIAKVWEWKHESGGTITDQLRRLGCSMDWSREQFTMDPHFTTAVVKVFVDLYNDGLIYRDKRLVNWDPKLKTAISDLEVETREVQGQFWHFRYPLADGVTLADGRDYLVVATTRPETMLADMAVAVHPDDVRYASVVGKFIKLPITGRLIPIVADEHADPELGSGAVKITPGHDFNDFDVGKRAGIAPSDMLNMFDAEARVVQCRSIPDEFIGVDRFDARKMVVERLKADGLLIIHQIKGKDGEVIEKDAEDRIIQTPYGDRGGVVIEPWLTDQWYVDAAKLAVAPIEAVRSGAIEIVPKSWEKTYFNWMDNIQPWCVSRQLWWGHRIPAWYGFQATADGNLALHVPEDGELRDAGSTDNDERFISEREEDAFAAATLRYGNRTVVIVADRAAAFGYFFSNPGSIETHAPIWRDPDVLDTWFSSALWPFATLGWPGEVPPPPGEVARSDGGAVLSAEGGAVELPLHHPADGPPPRAGEEFSALASAGEDLFERHYPNDLLISGFDILFFWCARMAMMGMHFNDAQVPWKRLYLHGLVRAADGQKMSKSKGNVVDPLGLIDQYGADALRFFMAAMESQGRDVKMDERRVEGYRNFATKLWNAARFCQANGIVGSTSIAAPSALLGVNKWIIGEVVSTLAELDKAFADLRFDAAANAIYQLVWDKFCDLYIEDIKPALAGGDGVVANAQAETRLVAGWVLDQILVMLHPFMPFVTEELWGALGERKCELIVAAWPHPDAEIEKIAHTEVERMHRLIAEIRSVRSELNVPLGATVEVLCLTPELEEWFKANLPVFQRRCKITPVDYNGQLYMSRVVADPTKPLSEYPGARVILPDFELHLILEGSIDISAEKARLTKALEASTKEAKSLEGRLNNPAFTAKAKPEAVEKARTDHAAHAAEAERLAAALARLG
jgi:valyl-tRNA synthetase